MNREGDSRRDSLSSEGIESEKSKKNEDVDILKLVHENELLFVKHAEK